MWGYIILFFVVMWVVQIVLSMLQMKHYQKTVKEMSTGKSGYLGVGVDKQRLGIGTVIIIVCNNEGVITDSKLLKGVTVFQRFKKYNEIIHEHIHDLLNENHTHYHMATEMAIKKIEAQMKS